MSVAITQRPPARPPCAGVAQIVRYNWPKYVIGMLMVGVPWALVCVLPLPAVVRLPAITVVGLTAWWTCASLAASFWLYDRSGLYELLWLPDSARTARRWANVHAGLDEFSHPLESALRQEPLAVIDIYDAAVMTERSIARARQGRTPHPRERSSSHATIPLADASCDAVFVLFAAHELRNHEERVALFREIRRALAPGGAAIVLEHLRDVANAIAFGPGFMHFFAHSCWRRAFEEAGLRIEVEHTHTPFARVFVLRVMP